MPMSFTNPILTYARFELNPNYRNDGRELRAKTHFIHAARRSEQNNTAVVSIRFQINQNGDKALDDAPFWLEVEYTASFNWTEDMSEEEVEKYLNINASAVLIGYIRPFVAMLTSSSPFPTYTLPFFNVYKLFER